MGLLIPEWPIHGILLTCVFLASGISYAAEPNLAEYKPEWTVGQTWQISIEYPGWSIAISNDARPQKAIHHFFFKVEAQVELEGHTCYCIRVDPRYHPYQWNRFFKVLCRASDGVPMLIEMYGTALLTEDECSTPEGELRTSDVFSEGPVDASPVTFLGPPLAFPVFGKMGEEHARPAPNTSKTEIHARANESNRYRQKHRLPEEPWMVSGNETRVLNIYLSPPGVDDEVSSGELLEQTWAKDLPWWLHAEQKGLPSWHADRRPGSKAPYIAKLTHVNGKPIEAAPKQKLEQESRPGSPAEY